MVYKVNLANTFNFYISFAVLKFTITSGGGGVGVLQRNVHMTFLVNDIDKDDIWRFPYIGDHEILNFEVSKFNDKYFCSSTFKFPKEKKTNSGYKHYQKTTYGFKKYNINLTVSTPALVTKYTAKAVRVPLEFSLLESKPWLKLKYYSNKFKGKCDWAKYREFNVFVRSRMRENNRRLHGSCALFFKKAYEVNLVVRVIFLFTRTYCMM